MVSQQRQIHKETGATMNIINPIIPTKSRHTSQHKKRVDLVPGSREHHTHNDEVEMENAIAADDKDKVFELAKKLVDHNADHTDPLLTVQEIAMKLNRCTRSIWRMVANGELPPPILVGHSRRWYQADLNAYLAQQTAKRNPKFQQSNRSMAA